MKDTNIRIPLYAALALAIALAACQPGKATELREQALVAAPGKPNLIGTAYAQYLVSMIVRAERIVISEHSDAYDGVTGKGPAKPIVDYTEHTLTKNQSDLLLGAVLEMDPSAHGAPPVGQFKSRHTMRFYVDGKLLSTMELCFDCGQIRWQGGLDAPYPDAMVATLKKAIRNFGLTTDRDWDKYALAHEKNLKK